jgi:DNA topoisomerase IA
MNCLLFYGEKLKEVSAGRAICFSSFNCRARSEIQNFNAIASYSIVAEFTNEAGKSFKAKLPKKFQYKKKKPKILNKNIGSICSRFRNKTN